MNPPGADKLSCRQRDYSSGPAYVLQLFRTQTVFDRLHDYFHGGFIALRLASSMTMLVLARVLQGLGGGADATVVESILLESFPPAKRGAATALFGLAIVVAPILGPTLGGWLTIIGRALDFLH